MRRDMALARMTAEPTRLHMRRRRVVAVIATVMIVALFVIGITGLHSAQSDPIERAARVRLPGLPPATPPIRVALLSDIHIGNRGMEPRRLRQIVSHVNAAHPDLVLLAGDFVIGEGPEGGKERAAGLTAPLSGLHAPLGVFAVLGNHDHWVAPTAVRAALTRAGIVVLDNAAVRRGAFAVVGIGDRFSRHDDIARAAAAADKVGGVPIVVSHSPDLVHDLPARFRVLLAGHTHCGQVVLPLIGPPVRFSRGRRLYDPRYRCGHIVDPQRVTFVTAGVGSGTLPLRFNAPPDWWLITLGP